MLPVEGGGGGSSWIHETDVFGTSNITKPDLALLKTLSSRRTRPTGREGPGDPGWLAPLGNRLPGEQPPPSLSKNRSKASVLPEKFVIMKTPSCPGN